MLLRNNKLTLTDEEVRKLQTKIRRINKDPEKFKERPDSEKEGLKYNEDGTWEIELPELDDQNTLRSIDIVHDNKLLEEIFNDLTIDQIERSMNYDTLFQLIRDNLDDVVGNIPDDEFKMTILDKLSKRVIDVDTAAEIANWYPIHKLFGDTKDILELINHDIGLTEEDFRDYVTEDLAFDVLSKSVSKDKIIERFKIKLSDLNLDNTEIIEDRGISIFELIKYKLNKFLN